MNELTIGSRNIDVLIQNINKLLVYLSAFALTFMAVMIVVDVFMRYVFNSPLPASVEASELIEPYVVFLPFAYTLIMDRHVRVTLITDRFPKMIRKITEIFIYACDFFFFFSVCYYSWVEFWESYRIGEIMLAAIKLPWWAGKFGMPFGFFFVTIQAALLIARSIREIRR